MDEPTGTFHILSSEAIVSTVPFLSSNIGHDAFHIYEYQSAGYTWSRDTNGVGESDAFQFQTEIGPGLGLQSYEMDEIRGYMNNISTYLDRLHQSP